MTVIVSLDRSGITKKFQDVIGVSFSETPGMWEIHYENGRKKMHYRFERVDELEMIDIPIHDEKEPEIHDITIRD